KTAATLSRSVGLGVQRPRRIASTRCSSSPARSASCLPSSPCSTHRSLTVRVGSICCTSRVHAPGEALVGQAFHRRAKDNGSRKGEAQAPCPEEFGGRPLPGGGPVPYSF